MSSLDYALYSIGTGAFLVCFSLSVKLLSEFLPRKASGQYVKNIDNENPLEQQLAEYRSLKYAKPIVARDHRMRTSKIFKNE